MSGAALLPGAEPESHPGGPHGALVLHGFTGSPQSMRGLARAFAAAGFAVELPRLPGHGTSLEDMATTGWSDWSAAAEAAYLELAGRCREKGGRVVVAGLSMGGSLTAWLAARHPEIAGIAAVNGAFQPFPPEVRAVFEQARADGVDRMPAVGGDIAAEGVVELAYDAVPTAAARSLVDALDALQPELAKICCPVLILNSPQDHVVAPESSDHLAAKVSGPVERVNLERSYHVATLDHDRDLIERSAVAFARRVTGS